MPSQTINLTAGESSDPITVTALSLVGVDTDTPVSIKTESGSMVAPITRNNHALIIVAPTGSLVFTAQTEAAEIIITTPES